MRSIITCTLTLTALHYFCLNYGNQRVYSHYTYVNPFSAGTVFIRQNLTSADVRFWRIKTIPALKGWNSFTIISSDLTFSVATSMKYLDWELVSLVLMFHIQTTAAGVVVSAAVYHAGAQLFCRFFPVSRFQRKNVLCLERCLLLTTCCLSWSSTTGLCFGSQFTTGRSTLLHYN